MKAFRELLMVNYTTFMMFATKSPIKHTLRKPHFVLRWGFLVPKIRR